MHWADWTLIYIAVGVLIVMIRAIRIRDVSDALDVLSAVFGWPITLASYPPYRYTRWRRERNRQRRIAQKVAEGAYTAQWARDTLKWKG